MSSAPRHTVLSDAVKRKIQAPCKDCAERHLNCHGSCSKYAEYQEVKKTETLKAYRHYKSERAFDLGNIQSKQRVKGSRGVGNVAKWKDYRK